MGKKKKKAGRHARLAEQVDIRIGKAAGELREHPVVGPVAKLGELADQPPLVALSAATLAAGLILRKPRLARTGMRMLAAHALATCAKGWIKHRVDRQRPHVDGGDHRMKPGQVIDHPAHNSFPSGHSAGAVAVARAISRDYPDLSPAMAGAASFAVIAQLPAKKHFPIDVLVGSAIGFAAEAIVTGVTEPFGALRKRP